MQSFVALGCNMEIQSLDALSFLRILNGIIPGLLSHTALGGVKRTITFTIRLQIF